MQKLARLVQQRITFSLALVIIILMAGLAVVYLQVIQLTTPGRNRDIGTPGDRPYQNITLTTVDGLNLSGWYLPGTRPEAIIVIHAADDNLFPIRYAEEMYAAAQGPKDLWLIERAGGHVNPMIGREAEYSQRVLRFFEDALSQEWANRLEINY